MDRNSVASLRFSPNSIRSGKHSCNVFQGPPCVMGDARCRSPSNSSAFASACLTVAPYALAPSSATAVSSAFQDATVVVSFDLDNTLYDGDLVLQTATACTWEYIQKYYPEIETGLKDTRLYEWHRLIDKLEDRPNWKEANNDATSGFSSTLGTASNELAAEADYLGELMSLLYQRSNEESFINWTQLRKRALLLAATKVRHTAPQAAADNIFSKWNSLRHDISDSLVTNCVITLQRLRSNGLLLGAVTNGNCRVNLTPLSRHFDFSVNSEDVGFAKPDVRIFQHAINKARLAAQKPNDMFTKRWVHVGDDIMEDMKGGKQVGFKTVLFRSFREASASNVFNHRTRKHGKLSADLKPSSAPRQSPEQDVKESEQHRLPSGPTALTINEILKNAYVDKEIADIWELVNLLDLWYGMKI